jgi:hypothetical protein
MATAADTLNKTARLSVLLSPRDKRDIEARARTLNMSVGEFVRRAADSYDPALDEVALSAMVDEWRAQSEAMRRRLALALSHVESRLAEIDALRAARVQPRSEQGDA